MRDGIVPGDSKAALKQPKKPRNAVRPTSLVDEVGEDELRGCVIRRRASQGSDAYDGEAPDGPDEGYAVDVGKKAVEESIDEKCNHRPCNVDEPDLVGLQRGLRMIQGYEARNELGRQKSPRCC